LFSSAIPATSQSTLCLVFAVLLCPERTVRIDFGKTRFLTFHRPAPAKPPAGREKTKKGKETQGPVQPLVPFM
jgi:hypothetical protein